ncbi:MAG: hypothetical protein ABR543_17090 [Gemmatimonadaceae bacterium]
MTQLRTLNRHALRRARRALTFAASVLALGFLAIPAPAAAQVVPGGDFDICDYCGTVVGNTIRLVGRQGFGTNRGVFVLMNAATDEEDVDRDGYAPGIDFTTLVVRDTSDFINIANPSQVILRANFVVTDFLNPLLNGLSNPVSFLINVPNGTPAGIYRGRIAVSDTVRLAAIGPNGKPIRTDEVEVEIEVIPSRGIGLAQADTGLALDSLVLRGRAGQSVSGVVRIANLGNVDLENVTLDATDLISTSGTGLRITDDRITFSPTTVSRIALGDTARVTVTVRIPTGLLAGSYRGDLIVQADGVPSIRVPLTVIVTTAGDIVFESNPVIGRAGDLAVIIFNGDPGTRWHMRIFDMMAVTTFGATNVVFAGGAGDTTSVIGGDQAVRFTWPLINGRGEAVAGGMYYVVVEVIQDGEPRQLRGKLMVIR